MPWAEALSETVQTEPTQTALGDVGQNHEELLESPELTAGRVWAALCQRCHLALLHLLEQCILAALGASTGSSPSPRTA